MSLPPDRDSGSASDSEDPTDDRIVEAIRSAPQPVVNTQYLAEELDVPAEELIVPLESLVETGRLERLEVRGQGSLWLLSLEEELESSDTH
ncbi:hypothetical protein CV102_00870 [Natronococcus pandeyae]|uniref:Uncharacterized protein n=1 Tax=Natronococcus pandeyae TaxID=2055836 RepID=A0A8J8Q462_9EURY|nr:hypothetical protein [Natronococcus pandeyae]TYL40166.1 hypothetical protein CV102_00870 [Natronococcus pandeyae]